MAGEKNIILGEPWWEGVPVTREGEMLDLLGRAWEANKGVRLGQLLSQALLKARGDKHAHLAGDCFYARDEEYLEGLKLILEEKRGEAEEEANDLDPSGESPACAAEAS